MIRRVLCGLKLLASYLLPFLPYVPSFGRPQDADCIFLQAFGRNSFPDEGLGRQLLQFRLKASLDDLETFSALKQAGFDPGQSNRALARMAKRLSNHFGIPIISQWEVVYCLFETDLKWYLEHRKDIDCLWPPEEGYFATYHVKLLSRDRMLARGLRKPLELAHPAQISRAIAIIWHIGLDPVVLPLSLIDVRHDELWVWDENTIQPWVSRFGIHDWSPSGFLNNNWVVRESAGRAHHILHRWVSFLPPAED